MRAVKHNRSSSTNLRMVLVADTTRPVENIILTRLDVHAFCDRVDLFTVFKLVDDLVLLFKNTRERVLETRRVPRRALRLLLPAVNSTLTYSTRTVPVTQLPVSSRRHPRASEWGCLRGGGLRQTKYWNFNRRMYWAQSNSCKRKRILKNRWIGYIFIYPTTNKRWGGVTRQVTVALFRFGWMHADERKERLSYSSGSLVKLMYTCSPWPIPDVHIPDLRWTYVDKNKEKQHWSSTSNVRRWEDVPQQVRV